MTLLDIVTCPSCFGPVAGEAKELRCSACRAVYASFGNVPFLLPDQARWRRVWSSQRAMIHAEADATIALFESEARRPALLRTTRTRLTEQIAITKGLVREVDAILACVDDAPTVELPGFQPLENLHLLFRDWGWPESTENELALDCVSRAVSAPLGRTLVVGAGGCRLAYDLHRRHAATSTVAIDVDPLLVTVASAVIAGESITLVETRSNAIDMAGLRAPRQLSAPQGSLADFNVVLANGLAPPFRDHSFDTVVTPWFVDVVPPDLRDFMGVVDRLLTPGGRWLSFGPLIYPLSRPPSCRFSREEIFELASLAGFVVERESTAVLPYSSSPLGRGRVERCLAFSARKDGTMQRQGSPWLALCHLPVPSFSPETEATTAVGRAILALVNGRRSITDIALALIATTRSEQAPATMKDAVRFCLAALHPDCRESD